MTCLAGPQLTACVRSQGAKVDKALGGSGAKRSQPPKQTQQQQQQQQQLAPGKAGEGFGRDAAYGKRQGEGLGGHVKSPWEQRRALDQVGST